MMKVKPKTFFIEWHVYPYDVMVSTGSYDQVIASLEKIGHKLSEREKEQIEMDGNGQAIMLEGGQAIIRLRDAPIDAESIACLTHEVFHVVFFLFNRLGIGLSHKSHEAFAYAIQYLTEKILREFRAKRSR